MEIFMIPETTPAAAPPPPPGPVGHPAVRSFFYLVAFVLAQGLTFGAVLLAVKQLGWRAPTSEGHVALLLFALSAPAVYGVTLLFLRVLDRRDLASLGARWPDGGVRRAWRQAWTAPLATLAVLGVWMAVVEGLPLSDVEIEGLAPAVITVGGALQLLVLLPAFLLQGGIEEWVFRGYVFRALKERWSWWAAALVSSAAFGLLHSVNPNVTVAAVVNTCLAGFVLALLVERSGSLWSATLAHGVWNFGVASLASLPVSGVKVARLLDVGVTGPPEITGAAFGPEGSLVLTALSIPLVLLLWPRHPTPSETAVSSEEDRNAVPDGGA
ncbi:MAG TPA: hypothetical protein DD490_20000 [Acidobacteria bacterium]|nr:hypothetical protein [Acidobacteriota bacterium]